MAKGYDDAYHDGRRVDRASHNMRSWSGMSDNPEQSAFNNQAMNDAKHWKRLTDDPEQMDGGYKYG